MTSGPRIGRLAANIELAAERSEAIDGHRIPAGARFVIRHLRETLGADRNRLFELFPGGYPARACRIARMCRPRAWSAGSS